MALLVPETRRATRVGLVGALTVHYGSPGRLADYRRQFEKTTRQPEEAPSIFVIALETLAVKEFGDMGHTVRLRDRFIAGHGSCELRRHLDSVAPETPIWDIVDRCRVWESHADSDNRRGGRPGPERALPIYMVDDVSGGRDDRTMAAVTTLPTAPEQWGIIARTAASHLSGAAAASQTSTVGFVTVVTTATGWGPDTTACPTSPDWNHCYANFAAEFASREPVPGFSDRAGPRTSGLGYGAVFLVWQNRSWGDLMSCAGVVSVLAAGMEGGEGGEQIRYDLFSCGSGALPGGKKR